MLVGSPLRESPLSLASLSSGERARAIGDVHLEGVHLRHTHEGRRVQPDIPRALIRRSPPQSGHAGSGAGGVTVDGHGDDPRRSDHGPAGSYAFGPEPPSWRTELAGRHTPVGGSRGHADLAAGVLAYAHLASGGAGRPSL